jgi:hypothetical protein
MRDSGSDWGDAEAEGSDQLHRARDLTEHATDADMVATDYADPSMSVGPEPLPEPTPVDEDDDQPGQEARSERNEFSRVLSTFIEKAPDTPFEPNELETVRAAVRDALAEITRLERVNDAQLALIEIYREQLSQSSERLGRKDWLMAVIGAGTALVIAGAVPPGFMIHVGLNFFHDISHLFD